MGSTIILLLATLGLWATGFLLWPRLRGCGEGAPCLGRSAVSVIIPARNEEKNLETLLRSVAAQSVKPAEVIVVDDGSTDRTAEIARQQGATVVAGQPLADGWRGKTWACHQGALAAKGELLLFLDADTWFERDGLARILAAHLEMSSAGSPAFTPEERGLTGAFRGGALSVGPFHAVCRLHEELSLFFNFNMTVGTVPNGLFGQMLLVDRASYWRAGGHEAVRGRTLENFFLAQEFHLAGIPTRSAAGRGVLSFRMYSQGLRALIDGWTKGFASGARQTPRAVLMATVAWMTGLMLAPIGGLVTGDGLLWGAAYLACAVQVGWFSRQIGSFRWFSALLYPVPLVFFFVLYARSSTRSGKNVTWKGRIIRAD